MKELKHKGLSKQPKTIQIESGKNKLKKLNINWELLSNRMKRYNANCQV